MDVFHRRLPLCATISKVPVSLNCSFSMASKIIGENCEVKSPSRLRTTCSLPVSLASIGYARHKSCCVDIVRTRAYSVEFLPLQEHQIVRDSRKEEEQIENHLSALRLKCFDYVAMNGDSFFICGVRADPANTIDFFLDIIDQLQGYSSSKRLIKISRHYMAQLLVARSRENSDATGQSSSDLSISTRIVHRLKSR
ncbi:hypothetical protein RRG08_010519 [Elysia crispata]|uniref:Uncharacterized protein n=1 Tax=Elysia crispata TaxID=231223 RepID=A0AAE1ANU0_9GAST|nr:hypothetical protein RRG08_010519 [Elysia crispata]